MMTNTNRRTSSLAAAFLLSALSSSLPAEARAHGGDGAGDIQLSYKRDPRVVDPYRGLGPWVVGPGYAGATAQDKVEAQARAVDAKGTPVQASLEWTSSDPEIVT